MYKALDLRGARQRRHRRIRVKLSGSAARPRLSVFRSLQHIYAQLIDDTTGTTLAAASTNEPTARSDASGTKTERARAVGQSIAQRAREKGISVVVFDRGGYRYHGRVKALADAAREAGLEF
ncbi:MAG: 50S ribosomal protein L18 [Chloroflexota bacterium]|nr:50S ribosomal protein L18 [Chloroflexota bacterium]